MSINLNKSSKPNSNQQNQSVPTPQPTPSTSPPSSPNTPPVEDTDALRRYIVTKVYDNYCDEKTFAQLIQHGVINCDVSIAKSTVIAEMELEANKFVNERKLLAELDAMLHQFTNKDKKLDSKEKNDAIQYVCKPRTGYSKGLNLEVAESHILMFCRTNFVKVKTGMFSWSIP